MGSGTGSKAIARVPVCVELAAALLCKRWKLAIVWLLLRRRARFTEISRALPGVSDKVLAQRLRELEDDGIVESQRLRPRGAEYRLRSVGKRLAVVMKELERWGLTYEGRFPDAIARHGLMQFDHNLRGRMRGLTPNSGRLTKQ